MSTTVTNQTSSPANAGQSALVTLNSADALAVLPTLTNGTKATCSSSSKIGYVTNVDVHGSSFEVQPTTQQTRFDSSSTPYVLNATESITLG
jgi:hypothetical protein